MLQQLLGPTYTSTSFMTPIVTQNTATMLFLKDRKVHIDITKKHENDNHSEVTRLAMSFVMWLFFVT